MIIAMPYHLSHIPQPMNVSIFSNLKSYMQESYGLVPEDDLDCIQRWRFNPRHVQTQPDL